MRSPSSSLLVVAAVIAAVTAQESAEEGPLGLRITGQTNSSIDGWLGACHTGAGIEALCYAPAPVENFTGSYEFYFNYTGYTQVNGSEVGVLSWKLPVNINGTVEEIPSALSLVYQPNSNVAAPMFGFGSGGSLPVGFDEAGKLFVWNYIDDSTFVPGEFPETTGNGTAYYNWYLCWEYLTGYYYNAVGWAQTSPPQNPTCQAIDIVQEVLNRE
ncbi:hypothetical protein BX600DRAFT_475299 [Xylariales sp. PMI_506]|nr:hypothetical protein BX600DRAFT_475299 [Xylariales sp. PMI_506]